MTIARWTVGFACAFVASLAVTFVGCRRDAPGPSGSAKTFVVAIPTYPGFALPYLAEKKGLFKNLKVELKKTDDPGAMNAGLIRGDIDACFTSTDAFVIAAARGVEAKAVLLSDESRGADGIVAKSNIRTIADLRGKKVAASLGLPSHFLLLYNLKKNGIPFSAVNITNMDADQGGAAFVAGNLDAAVTWEPWLSKATSEKNAHVLVSTKTLPGVILDVLLVRDETIAKHPDAVESFVRGYYDALKVYNEDKKGAGSIMAQALSLKTDEFDAMTEGFRFIPADEAQKLLAPDGGVQKLFESAADIWLEAKVIDKNVSSADRVTNKFVEAVLKK